MNDESFAETAKTYLRYSKRIIVVSLFTWIGIVIAILAFLAAVGMGRLFLDESMASVLKTTLTSSSTVTITLGCAYYVHSLIDKDGQNKLKQLLLESKTDNSIDETIGNG